MSSLYGMENSTPTFSRTVLGTVESGAVNLFLKHLSSSSELMTIRMEAEEALASLAATGTAGGIVALPTLDKGVVQEETVILEVALVVDHRRAALGLVPALALGSEDRAQIWVPSRNTTDFTLLIMQAATSSRRSSFVPAGVRTR